MYSSIYIYAHISTFICVYRRMNVHRYMRYSSTHQVYTSTHESIMLTMYTDTHKYCPISAQHRTLSALLAASGYACSSAATTSRPA